MYSMTRRYSTVCVARNMKVSTVLMFRFLSVMYVLQGLFWGRDFKGICDAELVPREESIRWPHSLDSVTTGGGSTTLWKQWLLLRWWMMADWQCTCVVLVLYALQPMCQAEGAVNTANLLHVAIKIVCLSPYKRGFAFSPYPFHLLKDGTECNFLISNT